MRHINIAEWTKISGEGLAARLDAHPLLKARMIVLLDLVENAETIGLADEAERRVIEELRGMGNELLTTWAQRRVVQTTQEVVASHVTKPIKKLCWHSTYGRIEVSEQTYWDRPNKCVIRPFSASAGVSNRRYSLALEEAITDFGAATPFAKVAEKIKRHYGIDIASSAGYVVTNNHAQAMQQRRKFAVPPKRKPGWNSTKRC